MANYYYVKSGGSAAGASLDANDGIYSTQKTGTWASAFSAGSQYFANIGAAVGSAYGAPGDGDYIMCSDLHNASYDNGSVVQYNLNGTVDGAGLIVVSVDDDDVTLYSPGASDKLNDGADDMNFNDNGLMAGVNIGTGDDATQHSLGSRWWYQDLTLGPASGAGDAMFKLLGDGTYVNLVNVTCNFTSTSAVLFDTVAGGSRLTWNGGAMTGSSPTQLANQATVGAGGGGSVLINGVDFSIYSGALSKFGTSTVCDTFLWRYENCKLHASATLGTTNAVNQRVEVFGGWGGSDQHGFAVQDWCGLAEHDDTVYVTADDAWYEGSTISSIKIVTTANTLHTRPFILELPAQYVDLGDTASDVLSLECVSATSGLQSNDIAAFLCYPDAASTVTPNWVTSGKTVGAGNYGVDPLATSGNALDAGALGAGDWTGEPGSPTFYKLELDTTGDPGEAAVCSIRIEVYKPSLTIYISPQIRTA